MSWHTPQGKPDSPADSGYRDSLGYSPQSPEPYEDPIEIIDLTENDFEDEEIKIIEINKVVRATNPMELYFNLLDEGVSLRNSFKDYSKISIKRLGKNHHFVRFSYKAK